MFFWASSWHVFPGALMLVGWNCFFFRKILGGIQGILTSVSFFIMLYFLSFRGHLVGEKWAYHEGCSCYSMLWTSCEHGTDWKDHDTEFGECCLLVLWPCLYISSRMFLILRLVMLKLQHHLSRHLPNLKWQHSVVCWKLRACKFTLKIYTRFWLIWSVIIFLNGF